MILTVTLNPSLDIRYHLENFNIFDVNRTSQYEKTSGGKGLNVSRVINKLGGKVVATGFLGGKIGESLKQDLDINKIHNDFQLIENETRNCINIISNKLSTEILEAGPEILTSEYKLFLDKFKIFIQSSNIVCASGSLSKGLPVTYYKDLIQIANENNTKFILDTSGDALKYAIEAKPFVIKPNIHELESYYNCSFKSVDEVIASIKKLNKKGVEIVIVSMGKKGALLSTKDLTLIGEIPSIEVINTVGCGDSLVAGLAYGLDSNLPLSDAFKLGLACSLSNATLSGTGDIDLRQIDVFLNQINLKAI